MKLEEKKMILKPLASEESDVLKLIKTQFRVFCTNKQ